MHQFLQPINKAIYYHPFPVSKQEETQFLLFQRNPLLYLECFQNPSAAISHHVLTGYRSHTKNPFSVFKLFHCSSVKSTLVMP